MHLEQRGTAGAGRESHVPIAAQGGKCGFIQMRKNQTPDKVTLTEDQIWSNCADKENKRTGRHKNFAQALRDETKHLKKRSQAVLTPQR